jgi:catechol 2,3-dioxygenase-like lactoylglutathione lyase family enzyme
MTPAIRFHHVSLSVADLDTQRAWYRQTLGFTDLVEEFQLPQPPVRTAVLQTPGGVRIELIEHADSTRDTAYPDPLETTRTQGYGHWALEVDDLDTTFTHLTTHGAEPIWPPADAVAPGARFAYVKDPEGNLIELIQPAAAG